MSRRRRICSRSSCPGTRGRPLRRLVGGVRLRAHRSSAGDVAATENADDLITNLRRVMNRARQDSITTEIHGDRRGAEAFRHGAKAETAEPFEYHEEQMA